MTSAANPATGPLAGTKVLDLTTVIMGPYATQILGDLGADVIKLEEGTGDLVRYLSPNRSPGMSGFVLNVNRNKRSVQLDLRSASDIEVFWALIEWADVFVTNVRPAGLARLGVTYEAAAARNPRLIYVNAVGYDTRGPYGSRPAYDDLIQAGSGLTGLMARVAEDGRPRFVPTIVADKTSGLMVANASLAALVHRNTAGPNAPGQQIEVSMLETMVSYVAVEHLQGHAFEPPIGPIGYNRILSPDRQPVRASDGWVVLMPYTDQNIRDFFAQVGRPEVADDPRFATFDSRVKNVSAMYELLGELAPARSVDEWIALCEPFSIPCARVVDFEHIADDPHLVAIGFFQTAIHPTEGPYRLVGSPVRFSATPANVPNVQRHAPLLGQHTEEVRAELGFT